MHSGSGYPPDEHSSETHVYLDLVFAFVFSILEEDREGARRRRPRDPRIFFFCDTRASLTHCSLCSGWEVGNKCALRALSGWQLAGPPIRGDGMRDAGALLGC